VSDPAIRFDRGDGLRLALRMTGGAAPAILFLPGYASAMTGGMATALDAWARRAGRAMLRLDYSGCGESEGRFEDGTLAVWRDDVLAVLDACGGDVVLVGSSMGGWLALLVALARPDRVRGLVGIAAAPDFTAWGYTEAEKMTILRDGRLEKPSPYGGTEVVTKGFWQSAEALRLTHAEIAIDCPVRLLHGEADAEVPPWLATRIAERLRSADVQTVLVKGGDHRLSREADLALLVRIVADLVEPL
jgi:pimeloyl-ACP methyl ester carboxylesterase